MVCLDIENKILELLRAGDMLQKDIVDEFPLDRYIDVGHTVRDMDRRGLIHREKRGATYLVSLQEDDI